MTDLLQRNLRLLPPHERSMVTAARDAEGVITVLSREGSPNLAVRQEGRLLAFHSRYSPRSEAARLASVAGDGTVVVLGLGLGYHIEEIAPRCRRVMVIESDPGVVRKAMSIRDMTGCLSSPSVTLVIAMAPRELEAWFLERYLPSLDGSLSVVELAGRVKASAEYYGQARAALRRLANAVKDDAAVQVRFGWKWTRNTLLNYLRGSTTRYPDWTGRPTVVTAAGPSLGDHIEWVRRRRHEGWVVLATDTSLPVLESHGVTPSAVISVDCQLASYQHFLSAGNRRAVLLAEISVLPSILDAHPLFVPLAGGHPLHTLLNQLGAGLPTVDTSGGNVTHAALSAAIACGAPRIVVVGADYSYPDGETYPRGSFSFPIFAARENRLEPQAGAHYSFLRGRPGLYRDPGESTRLLQPSMDAYRRRLESFARRAPAGIAQLPGRGASLDLPVWSPDSADASSEDVNPAHARRQSVPRMAASYESDFEQHRRHVLGSLIRLWRDTGTADDARDVIANAPTSRKAQAARSLLPLATRYLATDPSGNVETAFLAAKETSLDLALAVYGET